MRKFRSLKSRSKFSSPTKVMPERGVYIDQLLRLIQAVSSTGRTTKTRSRPTPGARKRIVEVGLLLIAVYLPVEDVLDVTLSLLQRLLCIQLAELQGFEGLLDGGGCLCPTHYRGERPGVVELRDVAFEEGRAQLVAVRLDVAAARGQDAHRHEDVTHGARSGFATVRPIQPGQELPGSLLLLVVGVGVHHSEPGVGDRRGSAAAGAYWDRRGGDVAEGVTHRIAQSTLPPVGHDDHPRLAVGEVLQVGAGRAGVRRAHRGVGVTVGYETLVELGGFENRRVIERRLAVVDERTAVRVDEREAGVGGAGEPRVDEAEDVLDRDAAVADGERLGIRLRLPPGSG